MTERRGQDLERWMAAAEAAGEPALKSFVTGLRADQNAVTARLTLPWSSGSVEGNVNRIILWNAPSSQSTEPLLRGNPRR